MRTPSRFMPKFTPRPMRPWAWVAIAAMLLGVGWAVLEAVLTSPGLVLLGAAGVVAIFALARREMKRDAATLQAMAAARKGQSICEFSRDFDCRATDAWIIRAVYEQVQRQLTHVHPAFPVRADDRLKEDLMLDDDDLDLDVAVEVEARTGRSLEDARKNPYFGKVQTVRDLVLFFQSQRGRGGAT